MAGGLVVAAGGLSLTGDQLVLLSMVAAVFALLLSANLGLCWIYRRLLREDQRQLRRAQKKKMSDVWVYQVHRQDPSSASTPPPPPPDPPSQQILRKLRNSYDNLRSAVEAEEEEESRRVGVEVRLGREESQAIEELEVTADLFLHDTDTPYDGHSRRSSVSVYDNDDDYPAGAPFTDALFAEHIDINAFTAGDCDHTDSLAVQDGGTIISNPHHHQDSALTTTTSNIFPTADADNTPSLQVPGIINPRQRHQQDSAVVTTNTCRSQVTVHSRHPSSPSSFADSVFTHDLDETVPNDAKNHSVPHHHTEGSDTLEEVFAPNRREERATNSTSSTLQDVVDLSGADQIRFSGVTMEDFENNAQDPEAAVRGAGGKRRRTSKKRRNSTYDNVTQSLPVAEFHNEAFDFANAAVAAGATSMEVANDLEL
ncbi:hypothetical protein ACOMHN_022084 [Nucella lapillus]